MGRKVVGAGSLVMWTAMGIGLGIAGGVALAAWVEARRGDRIRRAARSLRTAPGGRATRAAAHEARRALAADALLDALALEVRPVGAGAVELHGWAPTRALRSRALRAVGAVDGIARVIDAIRVHGEDDTPPVEAETA